MRFPYITNLYLAERTKVGQEINFPILLYSSIASFPLARSKKRHIEERNTCRLVFTCTCLLFWYCTFVLLYAVRRVISSSHINHIYTIYRVLLRVTDYYLLKFCAVFSCGFLWNNDFRNIYWLVKYLRWSFFNENDEVLFKSLNWPNLCLFTLYGFVLFTGTSKSNLVLNSSRRSSILAILYLCA